MINYNFSFIFINVCIFVNNKVNYILQNLWKPFWVCFTLSEAVKLLFLLTEHAISILLEIFYHLGNTKNWVLIYWG